MLIDAGHEFSPSLCMKCLNIAQEFLFVMHNSALIDAVHGCPTVAATKKGFLCDLSPQRLQHILVEDRVGLVPTGSPANESSNAIQ